LPARYFADKRKLKSGVNNHIQAKESLDEAAGEASLSGGSNGSIEDAVVRLKCVETGGRESHPERELVAS
jgi:hypothetical protein